MSKMPRLKNPLHRYLFPAWIESEGQNLCPWMRLLRSVLLFLWTFTLTLITTIFTLVVRLQEPAWESSRTLEIPHKSHIQPFYRSIHLLFNYSFFIIIICFSLVYDLIFPSIHSIIYFSIIFLNSYNQKSSPNTHIKITQILKPELRETYGI